MGPVDNMYFSESKGLLKTIWLKVTVYLTVIITDIDRKSTVDHGENSTQEPQPPFNHHEYQDEEETPHATSTSKKDDALKYWYPS